MKTTNWLMMFMLASGLVGVLAFSGCGKQNSAAPTPGSVMVDLPKLQQAFATTTPDLQTALSEVAMGVRYGDFPRAFAALDKLANAPGITDAQKKIVGEVIEQVKAKASQAANPSGPAK
jgi:hypothetical protein